MLLQLENWQCFSGYVKVATVIRIIIVVVLLLCFTTIFKNYFRTVWLALCLPGPPAYPIIGNSYMVFNHKRLFDLGSTVREEYGPIVRGWMSIFPVIFILEPRHIQKILLSGKHTEKMCVYRWMDNFLGRGLVTSEGEVWRNHRRMIQPAFSMTSLENAIPHFENGALQLLASINREVQNGVISINVAPLANDCAFNVLNGIIFGIPAKKNAISESITAPFRKGTAAASVQARIFRPWLMIESLYRITEMGRNEAAQRNSLEACTQKLLTDRKNELLKDDQKEQGKCFLDFLLDLQFTDEECLNEASTFMLAGQDTVAGALTFTLYLLAQHQDIQEKAIAEVDQVFPNKRRPCREGLRQLIYLEQCVKEALRLFPSVAAIGRRLGEDVQLDEYILPAGTEVVISPYATHRLPEYFPDPEKFNPDRFSLNGLAEVHPCAFIPFSAGPRNCIGNKFAMAELRTILCVILQRYHLSLPPSKKSISLKYRVTIRATGGVWIHFTER